MIRDASAVEPNTGFVALLDIYSGYLTPLRQQKVVCANGKWDPDKGKDERNLDTNILLGFLTSGFTDVTPWSCRVMRLLPISISLIDPSGREAVKHETRLYTLDSRFGGNGG